MSPWNAAALSFLAGPLCGSWEPDAADVDGELFLVPEHRAIWEAQIALHLRGEQIGAVTLRAELVKANAQVSSETWQALERTVPDQAASVFAGISSEKVSTPRCSRSATWAAMPEASAVLPRLGRAPRTISSPGRKPPVVSSRTLSPLESPTTCPGFSCRCWISRIASRQAACISTTCVFAVGRAWA